MYSREETGLATDCVGDCGTSGWRLLSDTIDSGEGHGAVVDVNLYVRKSTNPSYFLCLLEFFNFLIDDVSSLSNIFAAERSNSDFWNSELDGERLV